MPIWLISGFLGIRKAFAAVLALAVRYPFQALCIALLLFGAWEWRGWNRAQAALSACESGRKADRASYVSAQQEALRRAVAAKEAQEADYRAKAERANDAETKAVADARDAAARYIAEHRVRYQAPASAPGRSTPAASGSNPGLPESVPDSGLVAVSDTDVRACSDATAYAVKAHEWAVSLAR